ncbi:MAG: winged helix-turn-helix transcriptional regulator [Thermonemataceae bacterium]
MRWRNLEDAYPLAAERPCLPLWGTKEVIAHISDKMLTSQLRELEADGFISRKVYAVVPPKTEYSITEKGKTTIPIINTIRDYGIELMAQEGLNVEKY